MPGGLFYKRTAGSTASFRKADKEKAERSVMERIDALLLYVNREGLYARYYDEALMLAEKMRLF